MTSTLFSSSGCEAAAASSAISTNLIRWLVGSLSPLSSLDGSTFVNASQLLTLVFFREWGLKELLALVSMCVEESESNDSGRNLRMCQNWGSGWVGRLMEVKRD